MKPFKSINLLVLALNFAEVPVFANSAFSIEDAAKKGLITLSLKGKGGYTGEVIEMKIKNLTNKKLDLKIEAGRILDSHKSCEQDILVTYAEEFFVDAKQLKRLNVYGMCCQAHNGSPSNNSDYGVGKMADSNLIKLACYIDKNKQYFNNSAQQAVWTLSDNNSLGSICGGEKDVVSDLRNYVSKITGRAIPTYDITYNQESNNYVGGRATKIEGIFHYSVPVSGKVTVGIYDYNGNLVQLIFKDLAHQKGECKVYYVFRTHDLNSGTYYARMKMGENIQNEMKIEF